MFHCGCFFMNLSLVFWSFLLLIWLDRRGQLPSSAMPDRLDGKARKSKKLKKHKRGQPGNNSFPYVCFVIVRFWCYVIFVLSVFLMFLIWLDRPGQLKLSHAKPTRRKTSNNEKEHGNDCNKEAHMFLLLHDACLFVSTCFVWCFLVFLIVLMWLDRPGQLQSSALQARLNGKSKNTKVRFHISKAHATMAKSRRPGRYHISGVEITAFHSELVSHHCR